MTNNFRLATNQRVRAMRNALDAISRGRDLRSEQGSSIVEGALVFGIFAGIILAIIEFGVFFMFWSTGRNAATEAAHETAVAGRATNSDYSGMWATRTQLRRFGNELDYLIVYKAKNIKSQPPTECINAAEAGKSGTNPLTPHGVFQADAASPIVTSSTNTAEESFDWNSKSALIACNIYYPRNLNLIPAQKSAFTYDYLQAQTGFPSLDRFWPGPQRRDWINGPVDYVGIYLRTNYRSTTGIIPTRKVNHNAIVQLEPRRTQ